MQGYPQDWIYIERKVLEDLGSSKSEGVKAPINFVGKSLADIFRKDITDVNARNLAMIRPVIGANGAGKTTQMEIQIKKYVQELFQEKVVFLFFDFKYISDSEQEFWPIFIQRLYEQIQEKHYLQQLCAQLSQNELKRELIRKFKNTKLVENVLNTISNDVSAQEAAMKYFYGDDIISKDIADFFNGFLSLALYVDKLVVLCLDEMQFLIDIDPSQILVKKILEQFIRKLLEQYRNKKLYLIISCLQNPDKREYDTLKAISKNFKSIIDGKEIVLGNLTSAEKEAILTQVCDKVGMAPPERKAFRKDLKGRLEFFFPREFLQGIAEILDKLGYTCYSSAELRSLYEKEAREFIKPHLIQRGFSYIEPAPKNVGGFNIDIFASAGTDRATRTPKAFGEVTISNRRSIKDKVEKFATWLRLMQDKEYRPALGDYPLFICPSNRLTLKSREILQSNNITAVEFDSSFIEELNQLDQQECATPEEQPAAPVPVSASSPSPQSTTAPPSPASPPVSLIVGKKHHSFRLQDIPGIGAAKGKLLRQAQIETFQDLLQCNPKQIAGKVKGLGITSLNTWIQRAKQILQN